MKKFFKWITIITLSIVAIFIIVGIIAIVDASNDGAEMGITSEMTSMQKDSAHIAYLSNEVELVRNDSWTAKHLLTYNAKRPTELRNKVKEPIIIRGKILATKASFTYFGYDEKNNMIVEFDNSDDYNKIHNNQNVVLKGIFETGVLPKLIEAEIIDTTLLKEKIIELKNKDYTSNL